MAKAPQRIKVKPAIVDVGKGPQPALVPYPPAGGTQTHVLPPDGGTVLFEVAAGSYWLRRINEGSVVKVEPSKPMTEKKEGKD